MCDRFKLCLCVPFIISTIALSHYGVFVIAANSSEQETKGIVKTFLITFGQDLLIAPIIKSGINLISMKMFVSARGKF